MKKKKNTDNHEYIEKKLTGLMSSASYEDWVEAWEIIRDNAPGDAGDFDAIDSWFNLRKRNLFSDDMIYELDEALHNDGLDDLNLLAKRAEISRWVYTTLTEETELNLCNFRNNEAESLWGIGNVDEAKKCFQALMDAWPEFTFAYTIYGDCYWMSDWSYQFGPDYDRAEHIYRMALEKPNLSDLDMVEDRLDELLKEKNNPEGRERIGKFRLKRIQERKELETSIDAESPENAETIIGYSAFRLFDECYEYNENACFIADSPKSLKAFIKGAFFSMEDYRTDPVKFSDIVGDFGCSSGEFAMEPRALKRFEQTTNRSYTKVPWDGLLNHGEPDLFVVNLGRDNVARRVDEEHKNSLIETQPEPDHSAGETLAGETFAASYDELARKAKSKNAKKKKKKKKRKRAKASKRKNRR